MAVPCIKLSTGHDMPLIGFGTYRIVGRNLIYSVIDAALRAGYRSIDTAAVYGNEEDIGFALRDLLPKYNLSRKDIFLTSKLSPADHGKTRAERAVQATLSRLGVSYLDLYLVHWPGVAGMPMESSNNVQLRQETWSALSSFHEKGILRAIGVSNYTVRHLEELLANHKVKPAVNQVEFHPHYQQKDLLSYCAEKGIHLQAYSSFGGTNNRYLLNDPTVISIAKKLGKTASQVLLRWAIQQRVGVLPKSLNPEHISQNVELDFLIPKEDMDALSEIKKTEKYAWDPTEVA